MHGKRYPFSAGNSEQTFSALKLEKIFTGQEEHVKEFEIILSVFENKMGQVIHKKFEDSSSLWTIIQLLLFSQTIKCNALKKATEEYCEKFAFRSFLYVLNKEESFNSEELDEIIVNSMTKAFAKSLSATLFLQTPAKAFCSVMACTKLPNNTDVSEMEIFNAAESWIAHESNSRAIYANDIFEALQLDRLSFVELRTIANHDVVQNCPLLLQKAYSEIIEKAIKSKPGCSRTARRVLRFGAKDEEICSISCFFDLYARGIVYFPWEADTLSQAYWRLKVYGENYRYGNIEKKRFNFILQAKSFDETKNIDF